MALYLGQLFRSGWPAAPPTIQHVVNREMTLGSRPDLLKWMDTTIDMFALWNRPLRFMHPLSLT